MSGKLIAAIAVMLSVSSMSITEVQAPKIEEISIVAAGDNLIHSTVYKAKDQNPGMEEAPYDYIYENISEYISTFDIRVLNQETVLINDESKYSGYPTFGSPVQIGEAAANAGFNLITQATNHAYDKKEQGIIDSINFWQSKEIPVLGIHDSKEDADNIYIWEGEYTKIAFLNYTYGLNGFVLPEGKEYLCDTLYDEQKVVDDIKRAKELADVVIVFPHWGTEYTHKETKQQTRLAQLIADSGADVIIGCHPHVVEPMKTITAADGRRVPVFYSLGNFISGQTEVNRNLGAFAEVYIRNVDGEITIETNMIPVVTHRERGFVQAWLLGDYSDDMAKKHRLRNKGLTEEKLWDIWNDVTKNNEYYE